MTKLSTHTKEELQQALDKLTPIGERKKQECSHKWRHLNTIYKKTESHCYTREYNRYDEFFCEKCLVTNVKHHYEQGTETPTWFENNKAEVTYDGKPY